MARNGGAHALAKVAMALAALLSLPLVAEAKQSAATSSTDKFTPCRLASPLKTNAIEAECMTLQLPESDGKSSRLVKISIARVPAVSSKKKNDPIVILAGGPGMGAQLTYSITPFAFSRVRRDRDILLIDQRGTGNSTPLHCAGAAEDPFAAWQDSLDIQPFLSMTATCRDTLLKSHDLRAFTTSRAVRDLDEIRSRLGYDALNLYGVSYGTRVAQHYARVFPTRVRSMVLDGVVAPQTILGPDIAIDAQTAVEGIFKRCRENADCAKAFGDPAGTLREVQSALRRKPTPISLPHPQTGKEFSIDLSASHLATVVRLSSYDPYLSAMLPLVLHQARSADYRPLASLFLMTASGLSQSLAMGMHHSVACSEDYPRFSQSRLDRKALEASYLGPMIFDGISAICKDWPRGEVDKGFSEPLKSDIPTLLLSGTLDPVTPASNAALVAKTLRNSRHIVIKNSGHGQLGIPCIDRVFRDFFTNPDPKTLDATCLDRWVTPPFWTSLAGPPP